MFRFRFVAGGALVVLRVLSLKAVVCLMAYACACSAFRSVAACLCCVVVLEAAEALGKLALPSKWFAVVELVALDQAVVD